MYGWQVWRFRAFSVSSFSYSIYFMKPLPLSSNHESKISSAVIYSLIL